MLCATAPSCLTSLLGLWNMPETGKQRPYSTYGDYILPALMSVRLSLHLENSPLALILSCGWQPRDKRNKSVTTTALSKRSWQDGICHITVYTTVCSLTIWYPVHTMHSNLIAWLFTNFRQVNYISMSRTFYILFILSFGLSKNQIYTHG